MARHRLASSRRQRALRSPQLSQACPRLAFSPAPCFALYVSRGAHPQPSPLTVTVPLTELTTHHSPSFQPRPHPHPQVTLTLTLTLGSHPRVTLPLHRVTLTLTLTTHLLSPLTFFTLTLLTLPNWPQVLVASSFRSRRRSRRPRRPRHRHRPAGMSVGFSPRVSMRAR